jgi:hypothetical protein
VNAIYAERYGDASCALLFCCKQRKKCLSRPTNRPTFGSQTTVAQAANLGHH